MSIKPFRIAAVALAASTVVLVSACGDDSGSAPAAPQANTSAAAPAGPASPGGSAAVVDGKKLAGSFDTTCAKQGNTLALALTDPDNPDYGQLTVSATVTDTNTVQAVGIAGSKGGASGLPYALGYGNGQPGGSAEVTKEGTTYKVSGEGVGAPDMANPLAGPTTARFEITFVCSTIVGA
ncbi:lipoprotein LpqH [Nocardia brevicatena]|uniref:lipoprotein LpqH n=1 Tax=Nocardia brevicatena TaxID=37327 RepID=UPI0002E1C633|nr:lipoprotein LpqH [Nocardia brevicatena]